jgi:hypothetical protein
MNVITWITVGILILLTAMLLVSSFLMRKG